MKDSKTRAILLALSLMIVGAIALPVADASRCRLPTPVGTIECEGRYCMAGAGPAPGGAFVGCTAWD